MRLHLDTSFLIDLDESHPGAIHLAQEIRRGVHVASVDTVAETEYFAATRVSAAKLALFDGFMAVVERPLLTSMAARLAAAWLAPMDERQRRAHFGDALIGAIAVTEQARLVTSDLKIDKVFPVAVHRY